MSDYQIREPLPAEISDELSAYPELTRALLFARGITSAQEADAFLNPSYERDFHDPFLLADMEKAVERVLCAIKKNERIAIYSDFDCDGIPGGALLYSFFTKIGYENFSNYIPHRHAEGYGVNASAIEKLASEGVSLIITVDVGITDVGAVEHAHTLGVDVIVTDHHLPNRQAGPPTGQVGLSGEELPPAYAVINPKRGDCSYPNQNLCGCGVAFKLVQGLIARGAFELPVGWEKWLLDLAGIATVADMVPLIGENRAIAHFGLTVLRKSRRPGIQKLCRKLNIRMQELTEDDIGFMLGPRINAASRMDRPDDAFHLLSTEDEVYAEELAKHLDKINNERKGVVASMVKDIHKRIAGQDNSPVIVAGSPKWKPSLLGLAANSLVETYGRPVCLWGKEGAGVLKGSCRSDGSVNVVAMMERSSDVLIGYGGHRFSCGFSVSIEHVDHLLTSFSASYKEVHEKEHKKEIRTVDKKLWLDDVSWNTYASIEKLAPFGEGNPKPLFLFEDVTPSDVRIFGKAKDHLELIFQNGSSTVSAIAFFSTPESFSKKAEAGKPLSLIGSLEKSVFGGRKTLRIRIVDIV